MGEIGHEPKKPGGGHSKGENFSGRQRVKVRFSISYLYIMYLTADVRSEMFRISCLGHCAIVKDFHLNAGPE